MKNLQRHPWKVSDTLIEWPILLDRINAECYNTVFVSIRTL